MGVQVTTGAPIAIATNISSATITRHPFSPPPSPARPQARNECATPEDGRGACRLVVMAGVLRAVSGWSLHGAIGADGI